MLWINLSKLVGQNPNTMKKILSTFFVSILFFVTNAQIKFCEKGSRWFSEFNSGGYPQSSSYYYTVSTDYDGKDTLNNDSVKVLYSTRFFTSGSNTANVKLYLKQKGDTVFMNSKYTNQQWQILFNFAANPGDKWYNTIQTLISTPISYTSSVISTQTVLINGFTLKQLSILQINDSWYEKQISYTLTERIGSDKFVFTFAGAQHPDGGYFTRNLCYIDDAFGTYYYGGSSCVSTTSIEKNSPSFLDFSVFPNPSSECLTVQLKNNSTVTSPFTYTILNSLGEKIKDGELSFIGNTASINTIDLANGIYFLKVNHSENNASELGKRFVKLDSRSND